MDYMEMLQKIFEVCVIPLLGILTTYLVIFIKQKSRELQGTTDNELYKKYIGLLQDTIVRCVIATNQTYVEALKNKKFIIVEKKSSFCNEPLLTVFATESQFSEVYPGKEELYKADTFTNIFGKEEKVLRKIFRD